MLNGNSKYSRKYLDGHDVYAEENSVGILVFKTLTFADNWVNIWNDWSYGRYGGRYGKDLIILMVEPIGRGESVHFLADDPTTETLDTFYDSNNWCGTTGTPTGSIAYPGVHVIGKYEWK